jgi:hypothetical protein
MIVNTEAGNYSRLPLISMISPGCRKRKSRTADNGKNGFRQIPGELLRIALKDLGERGAWSDYDSSLSIWNQPFALKTEDMDWLQKNDPQAGL